MKGIIFKELVEMVEAEFGPSIADAIIAAGGGAQGSAYVSVASYPFAELERMLAALSARTAVPVPALLRAFGRHMLDRFRALHPAYFSQDLFQFLASIEDRIHVDVRKLYEEPELPTFAVTTHTDDRLVMIYRSPRNLPDLAEGLIARAAEIYGHATVDRQDFTDANGPGTTFTITRAEGGDR